MVNNLPFGLQKVNTGDEGSYDTFVDAFDKVNTNFLTLANHSIESLLEDRVYYVSAGGSNSNNGRSITTPFLTVAHALDIVYSLSNTNYSITIKLLDGIYSQPISVDESFGVDSNGLPLLTIEGNSSATVSMVLDLSVGYCIQAIHNGAVVIKNIKFITNNATSNVNNLNYPQSYIRATKGGYISFTDCIFEDMPLTYNSSYITAELNGIVNISGNYIGKGTARNNINTNSGIITSNQVTCEFTGPTLVNFINSDGNSSIDLGLLTYTGSCGGAAFNLTSDTKYTPPAALPSNLAVGTYKSVIAHAVYTSTPESDNNSTLVPNTQWVNNYFQSRISALEQLITQITGEVTGLPIIPAGAIFPFAGTNIPGGYLHCNGEEVSRTTYANLFTSIGTEWGRGNNTTTFNLPDLRGRVLLGTNPAPNIIPNISNYPLANKGGRESISLTVDTMPSHKHNLDIRGHSHSIIDRGHNHPVIDKQHNHFIATGSGAPGSSFTAATGSGRLSSQSSFTGINGTESSFTGIQVDSAYENITMATTGGGQPLSILQPYACIHYIIKF